MARLAKRAEEAPAVDQKGQYFFDMHADMNTYEGEGRRKKRGGGNMVR